MTAEERAVLAAAIHWRDCQRARRASTDLIVVRRLTVATRRLSVAVNALAQATAATAATTEEDIQ